MVLKYLSALLLPGLLVIFFTKVTQNHLLSLLLMIALLAASVYKGYTNTLGLIIIDAFSLTVGYAVARHRKKRQQNLS
ncbi:DUF2198 family protein [Bacillaceae bacterium Marseille-Q3522]|nr:DUF2198 family protein [Bacillaceae bacterium Marseille-Q3522]